MAFDAFTHRKKIPAFPSVFSPVPVLANDPARMKGAGLGTAGYAARVAGFNKGLYTPSDIKSPRAGALPSPGITLPPAWQTTSPSEAGAIGSRYRTPGTGPGNLEPPVVDAWTGDDSVPAFPDSMGGGGVDALPQFPAVPPPPGPAVMPTGDNSPSSMPPPVVGGSSSADQTQRFYDRKFGQHSADPATKMQARRFGGPAPTVDGSGNLTGSSDPNHPQPVRFNNEIPGHSEWTVY